MNDTKQQKFWKSDFGKEYTIRNTYGPAELDKFYTDTYGVSRSTMNDEFLKDLYIKNVLEVGCNIGNQLQLLKKQGFKNLHGIEIQQDAVDIANSKNPELKIIQGSALKLPYKDNEFDLVFTAGVLIHVSPDDIKKMMKEMHRVTKKFIWGFEYFNKDYTEIDYRKNKGFLWKADFVKIFTKQFLNLKIVKEKKYNYLDNDNTDVMFLLKK